MCFSKSLNDNKKLYFLEFPLIILPILIDPSFEALLEGISNSINDLSILKQFRKYKIAEQQKRITVILKLNTSVI